MARNFLYNFTYQDAGGVTIVEPATRCRRPSLIVDDSLMKKVKLLIKMNLDLYA